MSVNWDDVKTGVVRTVIGAVVLTLLYAIPTGVGWLRTNVVLASDLSGLAEMLAIQVREEVEAAIEPVEKLARENAETVAVLARNDYTIQRQGLQRDIRDLRVEISDMERRRSNAAPGEWTASDQRLLDEWINDYDALQVELADLEAEGVVTSSSP